MPERQNLSITLYGNSEEEVQRASALVGRQVDGPELFNILGLTALDTEMRK